MKLYKMIEIYLKYDNMHIFGKINAFICINNHVNSCINSMLSMRPLPRAHLIYSEPLEIPPRELVEALA